MPLDALPAFAGEEGLVHVVVESPRGAAVKLKYEPGLGAFTLVRTLVTGTTFPHDFGFVPSTLAEDGDPLDAIVLLDAPTYPGTVLRCRPIAVVRASQRGESSRVRNDRIVVVAREDRRSAHVHDLRDVPERVRAELDAFFRAAVTYEDKDLELHGWGDAAEARRVVAAAAARGRAGAIPGSRSGLWDRARSKKSSR